ncbi:MAG TPA: GumC family protein [Candidatus Aquilonibacter sp.]|jgi:uncharacterized protein involved in exopolysaccharide biosynthesis|nr:GumC family protein [Candidatus Aquilonibacter sp.]
MTNHDFTPAKGTGPFAFTMRDILAIGFRHKRVLVLCFGGVLLGTLLAALFTPPNYRAETRILVKHERVDPVVSAEQSAPTSQARNDEVTEEQLNSEAALVTSDDVLRQTVVACGLQHHKSLTGWLFGRTEEQKIAKAVDALKTNLKVEPVRKSNLISVSYESSDPKQAAAVLTTLSKGYIDKHLEVHRPPGQLKFFEQETELYRQDLDNAENQLKQFAQGQGGVAPMLARDITLQKLNDFNASLQQTKADLASTEQRIHDLEKQAGTTPERLTTQVKESDDASVLQGLKSALLTLELKRTELLTKYQPTYRLVQEVDKQIQDTRASIVTEESKPLRDVVTDQNSAYSWIGTELVKARADYSGLQAREAATQAIVAMYQGNARDLEEKDLAQHDLARTAKADEDNYLLYLRKREEARMADALDEQRILNVAIVDNPAVPSLPTGNRMQFAVIGLLLAATLSVGVVFTIEYLDPSLRTPSEVMSELNIPVLAAVPQRLSPFAKFGAGHGGNGNGNGNGRNGSNGSHSQAAAGTMTALMDSQDDQR